MDKFFSYVIEGKLVEAGIATTTKELEGAYAIRYQVYVERLKQISREEIMQMSLKHDMPELVRQFDRGLEVDYCDAVSTTCVITVDGTVAACLRLTPSSQPWRLTETEFEGRRFVLPERIPDTGERIAPEQSVEAGRFLAQKVRLEFGARINLSFLVLRTGLETCRRYGWKWWILAGNVRILERLREQNWPFKPLVPGTHLYHGSSINIVYLRVPAHISQDYPFVLYRVD